MYIKLPGKKGQKDLRQASLKILKKWALFIAQFVAIPYLKVMPNLKVAVAGPVFTNQSARKVLFIHLIIHMV